MNESTLRLDNEWLEADGLGGFASGTVGGIRTRRYHALLLAATTPPTGRVVLVNGLDAWIETQSGKYALSAQCYAPDVVHPDGHNRVAEFRCQPWPTWTYRIDADTEITCELVAVHERCETLLRWRLVRSRGPIQLFVRPFLSGRDYHALHHENSAFRFEPDVDPGVFTWRPYPSVPAITVVTNAVYHHEPVWYRSFVYSEERARGLDCTEDLAAPGVFSWDIGAGEAVMSLRAVTNAHQRNRLRVSPTDHVHAGFASEAQRRAAFKSPLDRATDNYLVRRNGGRTIVAGYPWFTDWGRDTFIALRGICGRADQLDVARDILLAWADTVSEGMLPNRFPDAGEQPY